MNSSYTKKPYLPESLRCPYCWHALVDHEVLDWDDYYSPVACFCCDCQVSDPEVLQRIADARNDRPD